ncbi:MAG: hypothetical protein R3253_16485 [Longimicrobiales bacterium]|nr:hypothetical protein [Longimicrobiales bacterium]
MSLPLRVLVLALGSLALWTADGAAQDAGLVLEAHGGVALPFGDLADGEGPGMGASPGPSLAFTFVRPGSGWRSWYAGFSQHRFGCQDAGCTADGRYVATGFNVGLRIVPVRFGTVLPWIRLGGITTRVETGDLSATPAGVPDAGVSDLGFGGEVGVGVLVRLGRSAGWSTTGLVSAVSTELPSGASLPMRYLTLQSGISFIF